MAIAELIAQLIVQRCANTLAKPIAEQLGLDLLDIAPQQGRQIGVDHRGVAATDELDQRAGLVAGRDLAETDVSGQRLDALFVFGIAIAVQAEDGNRADAVAVGLLQARPQIIEVERGDQPAIGADALGDLFDPLIEHLRQADLALEQLRAGLVADAQHVAKAARHDQQHAVALAFEQGVGGHRGAHLHRLDRGTRQRCVRR